jgi:hypothetical protein
MNLMNCSANTLVADNYEIMNKARKQETGLIDSHVSISRAAVESYQK